AISLEARRPRVVQEQNKKNQVDFEEAYGSYKDRVDQAVLALQRGAVDEAGDIVRDPEFQRFGVLANDALIRISDNKEDNARQQIEQMQAAADEETRFTYPLLVLALSAGIGFSILVGRSVRLPSERLSSAVQELARGNLGLAL